MSRPLSVLQRAVLLAECPRQHAGATSNMRETSNKSIQGSQFSVSGVRVQAGTVFLLLECSYYAWCCAVPWCTASSISVSVRSAHASTSGMCGNTDSNGYLLPTTGPSAGLRVWTVPGLDGCDEHERLLDQIESCSSSGRERTGRILPSDVVQIDSSQQHCGLAIMATKYQKPYTIPDGYPALLKAFTREVLRAQVRISALAEQFSFSPSAPINIWLGNALRSDTISRLAVHGV